MSAVAKGASPRRALEVFPMEQFVFYKLAFASLVFNRLAAARLAMPRRALAGDLVADAGAEGGVRALSEEEAATRPLADVLLPVLGETTILPRNALAQTMNEILAEYRVMPSE